jgi:hypothetical protein
VSLSVSIYWQEKNKQSKKWGRINRKGIQVDSINEYLSQLHWWSTKYELTKKYKVQYNSGHMRKEV